MPLPKVPSSLPPAVCLPYTPELAGNFGEHSGGDTVYTRGGSRARQRRNTGACQADTCIRGYDRQPCKCPTNIMIGGWPRIPGECWWEVLFIDDRRHANAIRDIDAGNAW